MDMEDNLSNVVRGTEYIHRYEHVIFIFDIAFISTSLVCNFGMIYFICGQKKARTTHNITIVSMAAADILIASIVVPLDLGMFLFRTEDDEMTPFLCKMNRYVGFWCRTVLIYSTLGMVLNRYFRITDPRSQAFVAGRCIFYLNFVWFSGAAYNIWKVMLNTSKVVAIIPSTQHANQSTIKWCTSWDYFNTMHAISATADFAVIFCIPLVIITILFIKMLQHFWKRCGTTDTGSKTHGRIAMAMLYSLAFFVCQLPLEVLNASLLYRTYLSDETLGLIRCFETLSYGQSLVNVIIYFVCSHEVHKLCARGCVARRRRSRRNSGAMNRSLEGTGTHTLLETFSSENVQESISLN